MILGIDMSLRSTGLVVIDYENNVIDFSVIKTDEKTFPDDEDLINHLNDTICYWIHEYNIKQVAIEGLSLNSKSARKDVIAGSYWGIRSGIKRTFPDVLIGSIPVKAWRSKVVTPNEMKKVKEKCQDHKKNAPLMKIPFETYTKFLTYIILQGMNVKSIYDLSDAYWIAIYRNSLNEK